MMGKNVMITLNDASHDSYRVVPELPLKNPEKRYINAQGYKTENMLQRTKVERSSCMLYL